MTEVSFYHLQRQPLERVLPQLLEKCLERGWRCVVQAASCERIEALDQHLWTYDEASFLPHGTDREPDAALQPVLLTSSDANPNGAAVRFLIDGVGLERIESYLRLVHLFDGADPEQVERSREHWRAAVRGGHEVVYWQQDADGRWQRK
jgi:DNA polymerase-3 subunit chi